MTRWPVVPVLDIEPPPVTTLAVNVFHPSGLARYEEKVTHPGPMITTAHRPTKTATGHRAPAKHPSHS